MFRADTKDRLYVELRYGQLPKTFVPETWLEYAKKLPEEFRLLYGYASEVRTYLEKPVVLTKGHHIHGMNVDEEEFIERLIKDLNEYEVEMHRDLLDQRIEG